MSISALKPGPVVPPGTQKVPNQAARISQSVKKCHLSDILGFLGGYRFLTLFSHFFTFSIYHFLTFYTFHFCHFFWFLNFVDFWWFSHFHDFVTFSLFYWFEFIFQFCKGYLKDKALFWPLFLTVAHSHGKHFGGVISLCEKTPLFFLEFLKKVIIFTHFWCFLIIFFDLPLRIMFFWSIFVLIFHSLFMIFWSNFGHLCQILVIFWPPSIPVNKCPFGSQKVP